MITDIEKFDKTYKPFLDELHESGEINMMGAGSHLQEEFSLTKIEARGILMFWVSSY